MQTGYMSDGTLFFDFNDLDGIYPDDVCPELRTSIVALAAEFKPLASRMLQYLALSLSKTIRDFFTSCHQGGTQMCNQLDL